MAFEWKDKVVLITGAATGIGAEIVKILVETENVKHVTILDVDNAGTTLQDTLNLKYGRNKVKFVKCDATDDGQLFGAFKDVLDSYGYIDVVVNNAGIMNDAINLYKKEIELNVTALCTSSLKALELMRKDEGGQGGTIINIASIAALIQHPMMPIYFATKSAVLQFSSCLGLDQFYSRTGVRVITLCFGATNTSLLTTSKLGSFDKVTHNSFVEIIKQFPMQSAESAARGLIEAYKKGKSGSTWLATTNRPVKDITNNIKRAYEIMSEDVFD
uniref:Alcohol dehydrogenase AD1 n=1 Tax=Galleria mellonella TaxID=7137 RepID=A0A3G1T1B2_GALME|nr:alcohol dehydrogenase AD1 [Galleria mellonella]